MPRNPDRTNLCHFAYSDGRRCTLPQFPDDLGLCYHHGEQYRARILAREAGRQVSRFLETDIMTACDLSCTLSALFEVTCQGYIKPKVACALGYLAQLMLQTHKLAKQEFLEASKEPWSKIVADGPAFNPPEPDPDPQSSTTLSSLEPEPPADSPASSDPILEPFDPSSIFSEPSPSDDPSPSTPGNIVSFPDSPDPA